MYYVIFDHKDIAGVLATKQIDGFYGDAWPAEFATMDEAMDWCRHHGVGRYKVLSTVMAFELARPTEVIETHLDNFSFLPPRRS